MAGNRRQSWPIRLALALVRAIAVIVPRRDRAAWRREWEAEIVHSHQNVPAPPFGDQLSLMRRSAGSLFDAAWLRRQFTRDCELVHDVRHVWRLYRRAPVMVTLVVILLAAGIGATTSVFSAVHAVLLKPLPFLDADRTLVIAEQSEASEPMDVAPANFIDWRDRATQFDILAAAEPFSRDYTGGAEPVSLAGARVSEGFFDAFGARPQIGRLPSTDDYRAHRSVVVLSDAVWRGRFGGATDIIGRSIRLDDEPFEVIGILPADFEPRFLGGGLDTWTLKTSFEDYEKKSRGGGYWNVVARPRPGTTLVDAQAELDAISAKLAQEYPRTNRTVRALAVSLRTHLANGTERPLALLAVSAVFILVLAVASVANLQLSLVAARLREFAVRSALGAARGRIIRQVIAENAAVAAVALGLGLLLAALTLGLLRGGALQLSPIATGARLNPLTIVFAVVLAVVATMLSSALPVLTALRSAAGRGPETLSIRGQLSPQYGRSALVIVQIALALVLLVSAGLLGRSFVNLVGVDPGLATSNLLALQVFAYDRNGTAARSTRFFADTIERIRALPGVERAAGASTVPFLKADLDLTSPLSIRGRTGQPGDAPTVFLTSATPEYFRTAGIPLRRGRDFAATDSADAPGVAIVNDVAARRYWHDADPVGSIIEVMDHGRRTTLNVVGVAGDVRYGGLTGSSRPEVFMPHAQSPSPAMTFVVRTAVEPGTMVKAVKQVVWAVDPLQTFYDEGTVPEMIRASLLPRRLILELALFFASVGVVIATAGAYGAVAWAVRRRTSEFGVRMALGATARDIRRHVLAYGGRLAVIGLVLGLAGALALGRLIAASLFEVRATDSVTLLVSTATLLAAVLAATWIPALRAMRIDPLAALRD